MIAIGVVVVVCVLRSMDPCAALRPNLTKKLENNCRHMTLLVLQRSGTL